MNIGDKVFVGRNGSQRILWSQGKVIKITSSGLIDVRIRASEVTTRFRNGRELGGNRYYGYFLDDRPYAEREALLAQEGRTKTAIAAVKAIVVRANIHGWEKSELLLETSRLEHLLRKANQAIEAI